MNTIQHEAKFIIGLQIRTSNEHCFQDIPPLWKRFQDENAFETIPNKRTNDLFAVYTDYEGDYTQPYSYIIGCEVSSLDEVPKGMVGIAIPKRTYAVFTTQGSFPASLMEAWQKIWASEIPRAYAADFEIYPSDFNPETKPEANIYISLQP